MPGAQQGKEAAALDAAGAALGSFGLAAFGLGIWLMMVQSPVGALVLAAAASRRCRVMWQMRRWLCFRSTSFHRYVCVKPGRTKISAGKGPQSIPKPNASQISDALRRLAALLAGAVSMAAGLPSLKGSLDLLQEGGPLLGGGTIHIVMSEVVAANRVTWHRAN